ncbi:MAG: dnaE2, partial [Acidimicrobiales bacterium]|nr:dnaE2 [Acidimicrobiales bacterium]
MLDLHTHSTVSDGSDAPERIPELAHAAGCTAVALTDHDRLDGLDVAERRAGELGVGFVRGCEISCEVPRGTMHVLIYFVDGDGGTLGEELRRLQEARDERNVRMLARLSQELGLPITPEEVEQEAGGSGIGRPHVAAVLVRKGVVRTIQEAFDRFLAKGRPGYVEKTRLLPQQAIAEARRSGAVPVLAHPLSLGLEPQDLDRLTGELAGEGLAGLEAVYGRYSSTERAGLAELARRHDLVATGGSDHHGTYKPDLQVGVGRGDLQVP